MAKIIVIMGNEHRNSRGAWARLYANRRIPGEQEAIAFRRLTPRGDRCAFWGEYTFEFPHGTEIVWEAVARIGPGWANEVRYCLVLVVDETAPEWRSPALPYPWRGVTLRGRLRLLRDLTAEQGSAVAGITQSKEVGDGEDSGS